MLDNEKDLRNRKTQRVLTLRIKTGQLKSFDHVIKKESLENLTQDIRKTRGTDRNLVNKYFV